MSSKCNLCGRETALGAPQTWTGTDGERIEIRMPRDPSALIETPEGDLEICFDCYPARVEQRFAGDLLAEIHYQFGLDCLMREQRGLAEQCLRRAIAIRRSDAYLDALAAARTPTMHGDG